MSDYRHGSHSVFSIDLHLVWITKYCKSVLFGYIAHKTRELKFVIPTVRLNTTGLYYLPFFDTLKLGAYWLTVPSAAGLYQMEIGMYLILQ